MSLLERRDVVIDLNTLLVNSMKGYVKGRSANVLYDGNVNTLYVTTYGFTPDPWYSDEITFVVERAAPDTKTVFITIS